jgi:hypothetical protein
MGSLSHTQICSSSPIKSSGAAVISRLARTHAARVTDHLPSLGEILYSPPDVLVHYVQRWPIIGSMTLIFGSTLPSAV